jgi:competence protein ComEA
VGAPPGAAAPGGGAAAGAPVDLNTATLESLDGLPGIGPVLAQRILDWRSQHSRFSSVDELGEVSGIGEATLSDLRPLVVV